MAEFKPGDKAQYIGNSWSAYTGTVVTVLSTLKFGNVISGGTGKLVTSTGPYYLIRFHDGTQRYIGHLIAAPPWDLRRLDSDSEVAETNKTLELET